MKLLRIIISKIMLLKIELSRTIDHSYRRITGKPMARRSMITPQLFLGGQYGQSGLATLQSWGITGVVSMRMIPPKQYIHTEWLDVLHLPTPDQTAPTLEQLTAGVSFIQKHIDSGGRVYIHCHHGEGRGPSMTAAYLISTGITLDDALTQIRAIRSFIRPTTVQLERLREFEQHITSNTLKLSTNK